MQGASLRLNVKIYKACVQSVWVYGSETWAMKVNDIRRLEKSENTMLRLVCGVTLRDRKRIVELMGCLEVLRVEEMVSRGRQRWYGLVESKYRIGSYRLAGNYKLRRQRVRGGVKIRGMSVCRLTSNAWCGQE